MKPDCSYCGKPGAMWQATGRVNKFYCGPTCLDGDLFGPGPDPWYAHICRWLLAKERKKK